MMRTPKSDRHETASSRKPNVFIGSSTGGLHIAKQLQLGMARAASCRIWTQGVFGLSEGTLESLIKATKKADFAILVLTPDDLTTKRGRKKSAPRDNVVFELGLFVGAIGRERTFIVHNREESTELPSDLDGVTTATFSWDGEDGDLQAAVGEVCTLIEETISQRKTKSDQEPSGVRADLLGIWNSTWFGDAGQKKADSLVKNRIVVSKVAGEQIFASGMNPRHGAFDLIGRVTDAGVLTFYYRTDAKKHFSGGVCLIKVHADSKIGR